MNGHEGYFIGFIEVPDKSIYFGLEFALIRGRANVDHSRGAAEGEECSQLLFIRVHG